MYKYCNQTLIKKMESIFKEKIVEAVSKVLQDYPQHGEFEIFIKSENHKPQVPVFNMRNMLLNELVAKKIAQDAETERANERENECIEGFNLLKDVFSQLGDYIPRMYIRRDLEYYDNHVVLTYGYSRNEEGSVSGTGLRFDFFTVKKRDGSWAFNARYYCPKVDKRVRLYEVGIEDLLKGVITACVYYFDLKVS
jgi:hypothetical protein